MHRLHLRLGLADGTSVEGTALDTTMTSERQEALLLETQTGSIKVMLTLIERIEALTKNQYFDDIKL
jgi:transcriptional antiterminator Rof (Rho-off)